MSALYSCLKGKNDTIMAANTTEGIQNLETEEPYEECQGKKKSKFKAFKKFFVKKKDRRKEAPVSIGENILKPSQSSSDISITGASSIALHPAQDTGTKGNMGNKALSHDSVFIAEAENAPKDENPSGKVKALQLQLQQNIRMGSSPKIIARKKMEDSGALSEDDGLPRSPPEITTLHEILAHPSEKSSKPIQRRSSLSLGGTDSEDEQSLSPLRSSVVPGPSTPAGLLLPVDFSSPASPLACLDNSAAKHRIAVKPKKQRGPALKPKQSDEDKCKESQTSYSVKEQDKSEEVVQSLDELNVTPFQAESEMEETKVEHGEDSPPVVSVTLIPEDEQSLPQDELSYRETDVDIHSNLVPSEDQTDDHCEETDKQEQNSQDPDPEFIPPLSVQSIITTVSDDPNIDYLHTETLNDIVDNDVKCGLSESFIEKEEYTDVTSMAEKIGAEVKEREQGGSSELDIPLLETEDELKIIMGSTLIAEDLNSPAAALLPDTLATDACNSNKAAEAEDEVSLSITMRETLSTAKKNPETVTMLETEMSLAKEEDKLITIDGDMFNLNDQQTVLEAENLVHKILEDDTRINQDSSEIEEESLPLDCPEKESKPNAKHSESPQKTSTKPVLFTVAPAWQRSLSGVSTVKDSSFFRNVSAHSIKPELFVGSASVPESCNLEDSKKENLPMIKSSETESAVPFGVRLRRTISSLKYNEEEQVGESIKQSVCSSEPMSPVIQNIQSPTKRTETQSDIIKVSKPPQGYPEDRWQQKTKPENLSQRQNSEPAWISMAKQKQKGFQDHVLAREQSMGTEKTIELSATRNVTILQSPELKENNMEPASSEVAASTADVQLDLEKSTSATASQTSEEPPWLSLAKKKAKAWSEMPQIVQ
ncbi:uncharacterized protein KIAA1210 homolog isoform 1 [Xenopus tropicalis]|uniref:Uncharacterized protein KIAA1210 homolog isoform 1 n=2 Tax=Xenopus tropicalis TaxID=8364 RepID=A0A8J0QEA0_XENTR|nr:uncharacterized protein KIAA1210 homolog isoform 1 [Xenopus tropicalis]|eukprot:XP_012823547.1 PREDICTED: uncharacterized protein KIAA1210 homolog isoform X1 [Xenopus tropicalis]